MFAGLTLGYLVFEVRHLARWRAFMTDMLGLPAPVENCDGSLGYRLDDHAHRLIVRAGDADDLVAIGLCAANDAALGMRIERLAAAGHAVTAGDAGRCAARRVERLVAVTDPSGLAVELAVGPERAATPFASPAFPRGFVTGELGLGHVALLHHDLPAMQRFYVDLLGFGISDRLAQRVGPIEIHGLFLHCNPRHHSVAVLDAPLPRRLHHFMIQAHGTAEVGQAFERAERLGVPLSLTLGQHPEPDPTLSFYAVTPSGFDFEVGAGSGVVGEAWVPGHSGASTWGHKPTLRLKWQTFRAILGRKRARPQLVG